MSSPTPSQPHTAWWRQPISLALALGLTVVGCASTPVQNEALNQTRSRLEAANANPALRMHASEELRRADAALAQADQALVARESAERVSHLLYLANQRITLAQSTGDSRANQAITNNASAERDRIRLAQRTQEADQAQRLLVAAQAQGNLANAELLRSDARVQTLEEQLSALNARKTERGMVVTLGDLQFDTGKAQLQADGARHMIQLAEFLKRNPSQMAAIEGYTDNVGSASSNQVLSEQRADAVMQALVGQGVAINRLSARGNGEARPLADNTKADGRQMNRRVEVVFSANGMKTSAVAP